MIPKPQLADLSVYQPGLSIAHVRERYGIDRIVKLASNENPYGCSPRVREAVIAHLDEMHRYPDGAGTVLAHALAAHWGLDASQFVFGAGSDDVVLMIARAYLRPGDETVMADRTFPQYRHNARVEGASVIEVPLRDGVHDLDAMVAAITPQTRVLWLCNPNNPTGTFVSHDALVRALSAIPEHVLVVFDEAYAEYATHPEYPDARSIVMQHDNAIVLRTFSKAYGIANARIGYGVAHASIIQTIERVREPFNTSGLSQVAAVAALRDTAFLEQCRTKNAAIMQTMYDQFASWGCAAFPSQANFVLVDVGEDARDVCERLLKRGIIVRGGHTASVRYPTHIRVTVGTEHDVQAFLAALPEVIRR
ncbi:MAG: histidinol-phosphate transaminase [Paenibacillaceae bacterium]|nr:histidinol-phosphate transaminase [Paenibacillaceae bacterium]